MHWVTGGSRLDIRASYHMVHLVLTAKPGTNHLWLILSQITRKPLVGSSKIGPKLEWFQSITEYNSQLGNNTLFNTQGINVNSIHYLTKSGFGIVKSNLISQAFDIGTSICSSQISDSEQGQDQQGSSVYVSVEIDERPRTGVRSVATWSHCGSAAEIRYAHD